MGSGHTGISIVCGAYASAAALFLPIHVDDNDDDDDLTAAAAAAAAADELPLTPPAANSPATNVKRTFIIEKKKSSQDLKKKKKKKTCPRLFLFPCKILKVKRRRVKGKAKNLYNLHIPFTTPFGGLPGTPRKQ